MKLLAQLREKRDAAYAELTALTDAVATDETRDGTLNEAEVATATELRSSIEALDAQIEKLAADETRAAAHAARVADLGPTGPSAKVGREARTYRKDAENSFFGDLMAAKQGDFRAMERISRHREETAAETRSFTGAAGQSGQFLLVPTYLEEDLSVIRGTAIYRSGWNQEELVEGQSKIMIPQLKVGAGTDVSDISGPFVEPTEQTPVDELVEADVYSIGGEARIPLTLLFTSPYKLDAFTSDDLRKMVGVRHNAKAISAITGLAGANQITATGQTAAAFLSALGAAEAGIHAGVFAPADRVTMTPRRWSWLRSLSDNNGRPLVEVYSGAMNVIAQGGTNQGPAGLVGSIMGLPVYLDPYLPVTAGAGSNEDVVIVERTEHLYAWTSPTFVRTVPTVDLAETIQAWSFGANLVRHPKAVSVISGLTNPF